MCEGKYGYLRNFYVLLSDFKELVNKRILRQFGRKADESLGGWVRGGELHVGEKRNVVRERSERGGKQ